MLLHNLLRTMGAVAVQEETLAIEDVFNASFYFGTAGSLTVNAGFDLSGDNEGLAWIKNRDLAGRNTLVDTVRGANYILRTDGTEAQNYDSGMNFVFTSTGFSLNDGNSNINASGYKYEALTFKKRAKFFDVVQISHTNGTDSAVAHALGCDPGMVVAKDTGVTSNWFTWHRGLDAGNNILLNTTAGQSATNAYISVSGETVALSSAAPTGTYIFYLWAHDDSADGVVQCGSYTTDASGNATVDLGWEPQWLLKKSASGTTTWLMLDGIRDAALQPNASGAEIYSRGFYGDTIVTATPTGFKELNGSNAETFIYLAIRRGPMRVPTDGTKVYNAIARTGTGTAATVTGVGFAPDVVLSKCKWNGLQSAALFDRLRGSNARLCPDAAHNESSAADTLTSFSMDGFSVGADAAGFINYSTAPYINWAFRRAPGFFDIVCDTGTGAAHNITHGLKAVPRMIWRKGRSGATQWEVWHSGIAATKHLVLNAVDYAKTDATVWNSTAPTESAFSVGTSANVNTSAATYVTCLFGDTPGLCKAGYYMGNGGASIDIQCGFNPRFILLKCVDATYGWFVFDSTRGIVAGNDPFLYLNSTEAENAGSDAIDPMANGFTVLNALSLNNNGYGYIYWACA